MDKEVHEQEPPKEKKALQPSLMQDILALLIKIFAILTMLSLVFIFIFGIFTSNDLTMQPAVQASDIIIYYRLVNEYKESDLVVLDYEDKPHVRRIVAVAGDTVDITDEGLFINDHPVIDQNNQETLLYTDGVEFPLKVPDDHVFVLGDNRMEAIDSRMYGTVAINDIRGKVSTLIRHRDL